jgi:3-oxoacyl-[acyl-carrier protein] reductase
MTGSVSTILITGASRGIGYETAKAFARSENPLIKTMLLVAHESQRFAEACDELRLVAPDKAIVGYGLDLADRDSVLDAIKRMAKEQPNVDVIVNNAGYTNPAPLHQVEIEDFERTVAVNLYAPFILVQGLLRQGNKFSHIVNVGSTAGINGRPGWLTYSASKAALINMSQVMKEELSVYGTRVVCLSLGRCATDLRKRLAPDEDATAIMQPQQVANVIRMMLSDEGSLIDSENLVVRQ